MVKTNLVELGDVYGLLPMQSFSDDRDRLRNQLRYALSGWRGLLSAGERFRMACILELPSSTIRTYLCGTFKSSSSPCIHMALAVLTYLEVNYSDRKG